MPIAVDLHSHSSYAGGVGTIQLPSLAETMRYKGINVFGIGDCLFPQWRKEYQSQLETTPDNLYRLKGTSAHFIRQTEVIFTVTLKAYKHRIMAHHIILFPDDEAIDKMVDWLKKKGHKNTIARPFIVCRDESELQDSLFEIQAIDPRLEIIPAHILTPDGILGSKNGIGSWIEFYGDFVPNIHAVETGLSADPQMLSQIPDLQSRAFISNSDCHSTSLNRVGREFTILDTNDLSYDSIIQAIRNKKIALTAEFLPSEGRYYLTGHRADRHADKQDICFMNAADDVLICPLCGKKLLPGVKSRALQLTDKSIKPTLQPFMHLMPLIEVIAFAMRLKSVDNPKVIAMYKKCLSIFNTEIGLWQSTAENIQFLLDNNLPQEIIKHIIAVRAGNFSFDPPGFDGCYGILKIHLENTHEC
jgi:PHP family Zn ribbon phosphoesterase